MKINPEVIRSKSTSLMGRSSELKGFWYANKMLNLLKADKVKDFLEEGWKLKTSRKVQEFKISPGEVSAHVNSVQVSLKLPTIPEAKWRELAVLASSKAIILAELMNGRLGTELEELFERLQQPLIPNTTDGVELSVETENENEKHLLSAAFYWALGDKIGDDPFLIFRLRGKYPEELVLMVRNEREKLRIRRRSDSSQEEVSEADIRSHPFKLASSLTELSYKIKADELPAALLKRLDPIPGVEDERLLEEAYEIIARRAQAYALSIPTKLG